MKIIKTINNITYPIIHLGLLTSGLLCISILYFHIVSGIVINLFSDETFVFVHCFKVLGLGVVIFILNLITYRLFPQRFPEVKWFRYAKPNLQSFKYFLINLKEETMLLRILYSISLSFFILSLLDSNVREIWWRFAILSSSYDFVAISTFLFIAGMSQLILFFGFAYLVSKYIQGRSLIIKAIFTTVYTLLIILILILIYLNPSSVAHDSSTESIFNIPSDSLIGLMMERFFTPLITLIIGSIPLGWFYELFVGSILKQKNNY